MSGSGSGARGPSASTMLAVNLVLALIWMAMSGRFELLQGIDMGPLIPGMLGKGLHSPFG